jgi:predicted alpha/beta superfamily hydrolase
MKNVILALSASIIFVASCGSPTNNVVDNIPEESSVVQTKVARISSFVKAEKSRGQVKNSLKKGLTTTGDIRYHTLNTKLLKSGNREISVYLPPSYKKDSQKTYPVFYMHDGQNIFDKGTGAFGKEWYVDEKAEYLIQKGIINEVIIVGVYNGFAERINELTWTKHPEHGGGDGKKYCDFLVKEVKPFIDKTYRTKSDRANTAVGGSSLGGLISIYLSSNYSNVIGNTAIMSPSIWWNDGESLKEVDKIKSKTKFWIDAGTEEDNSDPGMVGYADMLYKKILPVQGKDNTMFYIDKGAGHNEEAWAVRIHSPLIYFFGKEQDVSKKEQLIKKLMVYEEWSKL